MESWKNNVDMKFTQFLTTSATQAEAIDDLRLMFQCFLGKAKKVDDGSPSITQSALENNDRSGQQTLGAVGVQK
jgi:hypothetical protein